MSCKRNALMGVLVCALGVTAQAASPVLLVLEKGSQTLAIVDPGSLKVLARVPSGPDPHEVIASSDGRRAFISNYGGEGSELHTLSVVDLVTRKPLAPVDLGALRSAHGLDFAGDKVYFTAETSKSIGRYDPLTQRVDWLLGTGQDRTHMIFVSRDLHHLYTSNVRSATISLIEETKPGIWEVTNIPAGRGSEGFDLSPDGKELWAANAQDDTATVIDVAARKAILTFPIPVARANRLKFTPDGHYVLISGLGASQSSGQSSGQAIGNSNLAILDAATRQSVKQLSLGGGSTGILMNPDGSRAYVSVSGGDQVAVIDLKSLQVAGQIAPLAKPDGLAWATPAP